MMHIVEVICTWVVVLQATGMLWTRLARGEQHHRENLVPIEYATWPLWALLGALLDLKDRTGVFVHRRYLAEYTNRLAGGDSLTFTQRNSRIWRGSWERSEFVFIRLWGEHGITVGRARQ